MSTTFEPSLAAKLALVFGHESIWPNVVPVVRTFGQNDDGEEVCTDESVETPAVAYRLLTETGVQCFDGVHGPYRATYLIEMFAATPEQSFAARQKLKDAFRGPVVPGNPGMWTRWTKGGAVVRWATFSDPASGDDFPTSDAHHIVHFSRAVIEVTYE